MGQASGLPLLLGWQNFFMIAGTAAATLTGLMFVATSLAAGVAHDLSSLDAGIDAFNTPTVVHFGVVLLAAAILSAPWRAFSSLRLVLGLLGLAAIIYLLVVLRRMRGIPNYQPPLKDLLWYVACPLAAYILLTAAALALPARPGPALYVIAAALMALLFLGIHNAWDLVSYFAVVRTRGESPKT